MKDSSVLPDLRVLCVGDLLPHEDFDPRRIERLSQRISEEGILKNPPIVTPLVDSDSYVILDGANRVMAFRLLRIPQIVVQVVSYVEPAVVVDTWYHVVSGMSLDAFEQALTKLAGLTLEACTLEDARHALETQQAVAYLVLESSVLKVLKPMEHQVHRLQVLTELVSVYKGRADIFRASNDSWEKQKPFYPGIIALVIFPRFAPEDILFAARNGYCVPSGITRHIISQRALNVNIPLERLNSGATLEQTRQWLRAWLMERMAANAIRYYAESTFSFNE